MRFLVGAMLLAGCGRFGFDAPGGGADASDTPVGDTADGDAPPFVEPHGTLDPTFGTGGYTFTSAANQDIRPFNVTPRAAGGYLAIGTHEKGANSYMSLVGYTAAGALDTAFGVQGYRDIGPTGADFGYTMARLGQRLVIVGDGSDGSVTNDDITIGLVDESGTVDTTFGTGGFVRVDVQGLHKSDTAEGVLNDGNEIVVCGVEGYDVTNSHVALVRMTATGAPVASWGTNGTAIDDYSTAQQDECNDITTVGGRVITVGITGQLMVIAGYTQIGARDPTFATNGYATFGTAFAQAYGVTIASGDIVAVGESNGVGHIVRLTPDGARRTTFGVNGELDVPNTEALFSVVEQPNGKLLVAGERNNFGVVSRLNADGSPDPTFAVGGHFELTVNGNLSFAAIAIEPGGRLLLVGTSGASSPRSAVIARLD